MRIGPRTDDAELLRRLRAGDEEAFAVLHERYRRRLLAYARRLIGRSGHDAEDMLQDVMIAAYRAWRADERPLQPGPWLTRAVRNRCLDELRRARSRDVELTETSAPHDRDSDPIHVLRRRETFRRTVDDLLALPENQRRALVARELDGRSAEQIATELETTPAGAQMLVARGRAGLVRARAGRTADCGEVREALALAHERGVRASAHALAHLDGCGPCRRFRRDLRRVPHRVRILAPPLWLLPTTATAGKVAGGLASKATVTAGTTLAVAAVAGGGIVLLSSGTSRSGSPTPISASGVAPYFGHNLHAGATLPAGATVVHARVLLRRGTTAADRPSVALTCPTGSAVVGFGGGPPGSAHISWGFASVVTRDTTRARIRFWLRDAVPRDLRFVVGLACRRKRADGTLALHPRRTRKGETPGRVCVTSAYLFRRPNSLFQGTVFRGDVLSIRRSARRGRWFLVVTEAGSRGWLERAALCGKGGGKLARRSEVP